MPDGSGITFADITNFVQNLIANPRPVSADSFFQTRITRTPGEVQNDLGPGVAAAFRGDVDPVEQVRKSSLPDDVKEKLIKSWQSAGKGFIFAPQSTFQNAPEKIRHEQIHALESRSPELLAHQSDIASRISPVVVNFLNREPVYKREAEMLGKQKVRASEGLAVDLTDRSIPVNEALRSYVSGLVGPKEKREIKELTER